MSILPLRSYTFGWTTCFSCYYLQAKLFLLSKFVSAVQNLPGSFQYLRDIIKRASRGSLFLFVDNAHIQTKNFIEDLIFPSHDSTEQEEYKENKSFRLYTTYAELNSDREEGLKSAAMCEWVSLISYWLDRNPILDLRVNVHLAVKKVWEIQTEEDNSYSHN